MKKNHPISIARILSESFHSVIDEINTHFSFISLKIKVKKLSSNLDSERALPPCRRQLHSCYRPLHQDRKTWEFIFLLRNSSRKLIRSHQSEQQNFLFFSLHNHHKMLLNSQITYFNFPKSHASNVNLSSMLQGEVLKLL